MKQAFREVNFRPASLDLIRQCNEIVERYQRQHLRLTLRQLYYQLVSRNVIRNEEKAYKSLGGLVSDARLSGLLDWNAIEDRVRVPRLPTEFDDLDELAKAALASWRLPRWKSQENYVELWVEKDALSGVLRPLASEFHLTMMVNRGYSSQSAMFEAGSRFRERSDKNCFLLYLGDHDPSGEDMVRDVRDRLEMFGADVTVEKIALTMEQVEEHDPPPNPAKMSDSRAPGYVERFGNESWEVDALPPDTLQDLIRSRVEDLVDPDAWEIVRAREKEMAKAFAKAVEKVNAKFEDDK